MVDFKAHEEEQVAYLMFLFEVADVCQSLRNIRTSSQYGTLTEENEKYKSLYFLLDTPEPHKWFEKAIKEVPFQKGESLMDYALRAKAYFKNKYKKAS